MRKVRVFDNDNNLVNELVVADSQVEAAAQSLLNCGLNVLVDGEAPAPTSAANARTTDAAPGHFAVESEARTFVNQSLQDFHAGAQALMALTLEQTRQWLALGARVVDEDARRRDMMHKALTDLDIADRSIGVIEWQGRMEQQRKWIPEQPAQEGIVNNLIGAVGQLLDKKN